MPPYRERLRLFHVCSTMIDKKENCRVFSLINIEHRGTLIDIVDFKPYDVAVSSYLFIFTSTRETLSLASSFSMQGDNGTLSLT